VNLISARTFRKENLPPATQRRSVPAQTSYAERYVISRYDVSPSLARTIVALARLGGR
jgi:hypothetical protein